MSDKKFKGYYKNNPKTNKPNQSEDFDIDDVAAANNAEDELPLEAEIKEHIREEKEDAKEAKEAAEGDAEAELAEVKKQLEEKNKEYLYLMAEFDNFRKRTLKEKAELIKNAGEQVFKGLLPIVDDFERGLKALQGTDNAESVREGMELIYKKLVKYLASNGVKEFDPEDRTFDPDRHEAISLVPVEEEMERNRILDTIEKGYMINDKVLRHAKVVVGK